MGQVRWKVYIAYNFIHFAVYLPNLIKICGNLTKFWQKQTKMHIFWDTVSAYIWMPDIRAEFLPDKMAIDFLQYNAAATRYVADFVDGIDKSDLSLTPADWLFHAPEQTTSTAASLSKDLGCGTVFLLNFVHQTSRWRRSETDLRHSCSVCNCYAAHMQLFPILRYINALNNNNNNSHHPLFNVSYILTSC